MEETNVRINKLGKISTLTAVAFLGAATMLSALPAHRASALNAIFVVTKTADTNDGTCDADCSLREALTAANALAGHDNITLPAGTYTLTLPGIEDLNASGDLDVTGSVSINGAGVATTIINGLLSEDAIDVHDGAGELILTDLTVTGADFLGIKSGTSDISLIASSVSGNGGGGVLTDSGNVDLQSSTIDRNDGIGIDTTTGDVTLSESTISRNSADGITTTSGNVILTNSTISDNDGDGIFTISGDVTLNSSTDYHNFCDGIRITGAGLITLNGSIVAGSIDCNDCSTSVEGSDHSLDGDGTCGLGGTDISNGNPMLGPLQNNGGPTETRLPGAGSPVIDAGGNNCPEGDQRFLNRPAGAACDIGAVEVQSVVVQPTATATTLPCRQECPTETPTRVGRLKTHTPTVTKTAEPTKTSVPATKTNTPVPPAFTGDRAGAVRGPDTGSGGDSDGGSQDYSWAIIALALGGAGALVAGVRRRA